MFVSLVKNEMGKIQKMINMSTIVPYLRDKDTTYFGSFCSSSFLTRIDQYLVVHRIGITPNIPLCTLIIIFFFLSLHCEHVRGL